MNTGPFFFRTGKSDRVYFFTARNSAGLQRSGFARVKPPLTCIFSEPVKVAWQDTEWK